MCRWLREKKREKAEFGEKRKTISWNRWGKRKRVAQVALFVASEKTLPGGSGAGHIVDVMNGAGVVLNLGVAGEEL